MKTQHNFKQYVTELVAIAISILKDSKGRLREMHLVAIINALHTNHPHLVYLRGLERFKGKSAPLLGPDVKASLKEHKDIVTYKIGNARFYEVKTLGA